MSERLFLPKYAGIRTYADGRNPHQVIAEVVGGSVEDVSDGFHSFAELYRFRALYNAAFFNELKARDEHRVHKSWKHADGQDCFGGGWFVVTAYLDGRQVSNHYEAKYWELFQCEVRETADEWDKHTPEDVVERLERFIKGGE